MPFAGTDDTSRTHFETQDTIELGQPLDGTRNYHSGFMSRTAQALSGSTPDRLHQPPCRSAFRGGAPIPNIALNFTGKPGVDGQECGPDPGHVPGPGSGAGRGGRLQGAGPKSIRRISGEMQAANRDAVSRQGL